MMSSQLALWMLVLAGAVASPDGIPPHTRSQVEARDPAQSMLVPGPSTQEQRLLKRRGAGKTTQVALLGADFAESDR